MIVSRVIEIDMGHTLPLHYGFCNQIHGHRVKIECFFSGEVKDAAFSGSNGMVIDFSKIKEIMWKEIHDVLDHGFAIWKNEQADIVEVNGVKITAVDFIKARNKKVLITDLPPTAEVLGEHFFKKIKKAIKLIDENIELVELHWYETPNNRAIIK